MTIRFRRRNENQIIQEADEREADIKRRTSRGRHQEADIRRRTSGGRHQEADIRRRTSGGSDKRRIGQAADRTSRAVHGGQHTKVERTKEKCTAGRRFLILNVHDLIDIFLVQLRLQFRTSLLKERVFTVACRSHEVVALAPSPQQLNFIVCSEHELGTTKAR